MKVLRIVPLLDFGGVEQRVKLTTIGFQAHGGVEFDVLVLGSGGQVSAELISLGFRPVILDHDIKIPNIKLIYDLYRILLKKRPDVVHTSGSEANFHGLIAAKLAGVPVRIGEEIGFPNHDWKWKWIFNLVYKSATKIIAISQAVRQRIVELKEVEESKVEVVYNPVELSKNDEANSIDGDEIATIIRNATKEYKKPFIFLTTCRLVPVKNLDTLIRAFHQIVNEKFDREFLLWIVGDGPERTRLEMLANNLGVGRIVFFWGVKKNVEIFLAKADLFVLPSFSEGFSISLVEAMLSGLPCIVTDQGGPVEIVSDGVTGLLVNPYDSDDLVEKMRFLISMNDDVRSLVGFKAQKEGEKYSVSNYISNLCRVYKGRE